jgi:hypothetical protein
LATLASTFNPQKELQKYEKDAKNEERKYAHKKR